MHISLNWLRDFVDIPSKITPKELGQLLTLKTAEVEAVESQEEAFENMVTGKLISLEKHPDADSLQVAKVDVGNNEILQIVCGGSNLTEGMCVAVTKVGSKVKWHGEGDLVTLSATKVRGVESQGMIAAGVEIGIAQPGAKEREILDLSAQAPKPGTPLSEFYAKNDHILEIDNKSLTHRPDLWGHLGIAREVAAITKGKFKFPNPQPNIPTTGEQIKVEVKDDKLCPRFSALIIENVKVEQSPDWLKDRLQAVGHGTHNNIVDVTNYVMAEIGQPMHAFDKNLIDGGLTIRMAKKGEKLTTLDGKERELSEDIGVVADDGKALSLAGIIGGANSEIRDNTTTVILEAANWHPSMLRRASIKIGVRTDAVQRFEKSLDPELTELAIKRAAELILEICPGAKIAGPMTDVYTNKPSPKTIKLDTDKARSKIGIEISNEQIKETLESLEFEVAGSAPNIFEVTIPSFRATKDVGIEDDLIEEIARIYGYDNIPVSLPTLPARLPSEHVERQKKHQARMLFSYGLGFDEVYNYSFYGEKELKNCLMTEDVHLKLLNYLSEDQTHLRTSLVPNLLKNLQSNAKNYDEMSIYEIGHSYKDIGADYLPLEEKKLTGAIMVKGKNEEVFYKAKGAVEAFFKHFQLTNISSAKGVEKTPYAHPTKAITYIDGNGQTIAKVFMLHPLVSRNHDLENYSTAILFINFTEAVKLEPTPKRYSQIARFPSIEFDLSVVVDKEMEVATVHESIQKADRDLITSVTLFDIYEGPGLGENKKAVAYKVTLQAKDRTLTEDELKATEKKIFNNLEKIGGVVRGR